MKKRQFWHFKKESGIEDSDALVPYKSRPIRYESDPINYQTPRQSPKGEKREIEYFPALKKHPEWIEKLREIYPEIVGMSEEEINAYFGNTPVEDLLKRKVAKSALWHFSKEKDIEQTADDPASGRPAQPDHFPNVIRPGGGYPEGRGEKTDAFCNKCKDQLIDGSCLRCDWGPQNRSVPVENFPLDPFEDDKAGTRAASWKFGMPRPALTPEKIYEKSKTKGDPLYNILKEQKLTIPNANSIKKNDRKGDVKGLSSFMADNVTCGNCNSKDAIIRSLSRPRCSVCKLAVPPPQENLTPEQIYQKSKTEGDPFYEALKDQELKIPSVKNIQSRNDSTKTGLASFMAKGATCNKCNSKNIDIPNLGTPRCSECTRNFRRNIENQNKIKESMNQYLEPDWQIDWSEMQQGLQFSTSKVPLIHNKCGEKQTYLIRTIRSWIDNNQAPPCLNKKCEDFDPIRGKWDPSKPGYLYIYQYGTTIVIGITNNWEQRMVQYQSNPRHKIQGPSGNLLDYILDRVDFSQVDVEHHSVKNGNLRVPTQKELRSRGLVPLGSKSTEETGLVTIPAKLRQRIEEKRDLILNNPNFKRYRQRVPRRKKQRELEKQGSNEILNVPESAHVFGPIKGYVVENIENAIIQWWASLNITPVLDAQTHTESMSVAADPSGATVNGMDIGSDLTLDLHIFLIQQMIENGGHLNKLSEVISPEDQQQLTSFFENNPNKLTAAFGMSYDNETDQYGLGGNILGDAIGINQLLTGAEMGYFDEQGQFIPNTDQEFVTRREQELKTTIPETLVEKGLRDPASGDWQQRPLDEWTGLAKPEIPIAESVNQTPDLSVQVNVPFSTPDGRTLLLDENGWYWQAYQNEWHRVAKTSDYQGWTNWETWNTKLMIDNDYEPYMQSRQLVQNFTPINQFAMWATETILAPHNQQALADAQEWNEIPYDERPTGREDISEGGQALIESFDEIFDMDPRSDETAQIIDESKVNWNEIYNSIGEDIKESERFAHEEGEHDLLVSDYMTEYSAPELAEAQAEEHPWCPACNVEKPDDPGTTTFPTDWA